MTIKIYKPVTPGRRGMTSIDYSKVLSGDKPFKPLMKPLPQRGGRSRMTGRMTVDHQGGGHKRMYRIVDFRQADKLNIPAKVETIEYDPNRSAFIALMLYKDGERRYMLAPDGLKVNDEFVCSEQAKAKIGNRMLIKNIPEGTQIYNIELRIGKGGQMIRSAGTSATLMSLQSDMAQIKMPSGEVRFISKDCFASIGVVSNTDYNLVNIGKAGRSRWMGIRPVVLGKAKNVRDHPHGAGEGGTSIGMKHPKTPWGKNARGVRTRNNKRTERFIIKKRYEK